MDGKSFFFSYKSFLFSEAVAIAFWDIRMKIDRLPNFNMLFQNVLTKCFKSELSFNESRDQVMQKAYYAGLGEVIHLYR